MTTILIADMPANSLPDTVRVSTPEYPGGPWYSYVRGYDPATDHLDVRLELPDEHPAIKDAVADAGIAADDVEIIAYVPRDACVDGFGDSIPDPRPALAMRVDAARRAEEDARRAADDAARRTRIEAVRRELVAGTRRTAFPELGPLRGRRY